MNVVLDTNVLVSAMLSPDAPPSEIVHMLLRRKLRACVDSRILAEYSRVLQRPKLQIEPARVNSLLGEVRRFGLAVSGSPLPTPLPDPNDAPFLEVAVAARAERLITGNLRHFPAKCRQGVRVLSPAQFVEYCRGSSRIR